MTKAVSRLVLAAAVRAMPPARGEWARAMEAEFLEASIHGRPLRFAAGCLVAAYGALPFHPSGRFALSRHAVALGLALPAGVFHLGCALSGARLATTGDDPFHSRLTAGAAASRALADAYLATAPAATTLMLVLGAAHVLVAWHLLDGRWRRTAGAWSVGAAAAAGLVAIIARIVPGPRAAMFQLAPLAIELLALTLLFTWWTRLNQSRTEHRR